MSEASHRAGRVGAAYEAASVPPPSWMSAVGASALTRDAGAAWPPGSGRLASHLGWLAREAWPATSHPGPHALAAAVAKATRLRLTVHQPQGAAWAVRNAAAAVRDGMEALGLSVARWDAADPEAGADLRFTICDADAIERAVEELAPDGSDRLVIAGAVREADLVQALPHLRRIPSAAGTDPATVALLQAAGVPAMLWTPLRARSGKPMEGLDDPLVRGLPRAARRPLDPAGTWSERPLDIVSLGPEEPTRTYMLGAGADALARRSCVLVHRRAMWRLADEPILAEAAADYLFRRAKVVLNVHAGEAAALDWSQGVLDAMALGAVAVSTPCFPHPYLREGVHYLEATPDRMLQLVEWLLDTPEGARTADAVRRATAGALVREAAPATMAARLLNHALAASTRPQ